MIRTETRGLPQVTAGPWLLPPPGAQPSAALPCSWRTNLPPPWRLVSLDQWLQTGGAEFKQWTRAPDGPKAKLLSSCLSVLVFESAGVREMHLDLLQLFSCQPANHLEAKLHSRRTKERQAGWRPLWRVKSVYLRKGQLNRKKNYSRQDFHLLSEIVLQVLLQIWMFCSLIDSQSLQGNS